MILKETDKHISSSNQYETKELLFPEIVITSGKYYRCDMEINAQKRQ